MLICKISDPELIFAFLFLRNRQNLTKSRCRAIHYKVNLQQHFQNLHGEPPEGGQSRDGGIHFTVMRHAYRTFG